MTVEDSFSRSPRVHIASGLKAGTVMSLDERQAHHLRQVLRLQDGNAIRVFNAEHGEFGAYLRYDGKRGAAVDVQILLREVLPAGDIWLVASPLKKDALDVMVEKASELGASRFVPVITDHTVVHRLNSDRLSAQATDAAEQCERLDIMQIDALVNLTDVLKDWPQDRRLYVALERSAAAPFLQVLQRDPLGAHTPAALLVGPEGGFSARERDQLLALSFVQPVSLGPTILRAETAAIAGLTVLAAFLHAHTG